MQAIELILVTQKNTMLAEYPNHQALTTIVFEEISAMLHEDFDEITRLRKRWQLVFDCIADVLTKAHLQDVRKTYATDLLDVFLDTTIVSYMRNKLQDTNDHYIGILQGARGELCTSQWSDTTSKHWERVISRLRM